MITTTQMYWLTRLDSIKGTLDGFTPVFVLGTVVLVVIAILAYCLGTFTGNSAYDMFSGRTNDELKSVHARLRRVSARCAIAIFLLFSAIGAIGVLDALLPSTREMAAIIMVPAVVNNEKVQTVGNKLYDLAVEWLETLKPTKETQK